MISRDWFASGEKQMLNHVITCRARICKYLNSFVPPQLNTKDIHWKRRICIKPLTAGMH